MTRLIQLVLLIAIIIPFGMAKARAQDVAKILGEAKGEWEWCVQAAHSLAGPIEIMEIGRRSEAVLSECKAEEELLLALIDMAPTERTRVQSRLLHFKAKVQLKTRLTNEALAALKSKVDKR